MAPEQTSAGAERIKVKPVATRAVQPGLLEWCTIAVEDMAVAVERLNRDIDDNRTNNVILRDVLNIFSLQRWAFVLPGGGAVRGGRIRRVRVGRAPSAMPPRPRRTQPADATTPQATNVPINTTVRPMQANVPPPPPPASSSNPVTGRVVIESSDFKAEPKTDGEFFRKK